MGGAPAEATVAAWTLPHTSPQLGTRCSCWVQQRQSWCTGHPARLFIKKNKQGPRKHGHMLSVTKFLGSWPGDQSPPTLGGAVSILPRGVCSLGSVTNGTIAGKRTMNHTQSEGPLRTKDRTPPGMPTSQSAAETRR